MLKRLILAIIFLAIVVGGLVGFNLFRKQAIQNHFANMPKQIMTVSTYTVEPLVWTPGIEAIGTANASQGVDLTFQVAGVVKDILFQANEQVKTGQLLAKLDDEIEKADVAAAKAEAALSEVNLKRAQTLRTQGVGAVSNVDTTAAAAASANAQVAKLQAVLDKKLLSAPFDGIIGIPRIDVGQYVTGGTQIATLQNLDTMRVDFAVPEGTLSQIYIGQEVQAGADLQNLTATGTITGIDPKINASSRMVAVRAVVKNDAKTLTPGQFVQVKIVLPTEENVLALPQTAVITSLYGDYVFLVRPVQAEEGKEAPLDADGQPQLSIDQVFVTTGRRSGQMVEILKGLSKGDQIVSAGQNRLAAKMYVKIDNTVNPANAETK